MELIKAVNNSMSVQKGDIFNIEGVAKTVTLVSKVYVYFDKGKHTYFKSFNYLVRQCKQLQKDRAEFEYRKLNQTNSLSYKQYPTNLRYLLFEFYKFKDNVIVDRSYEWIFANKHTSHAEMQEEYTKKEDCWTPITSGGFYYCEDETIVIYGESGSFGKLKNKELRKLTKFIKGGYKVIVR